MLQNIKAPYKRNFRGDPSEIIQHFPKFNFQVLCCRYWWLKNWEYKELSFPYWRIYYNRQEGACIDYKHQCFPLLPDTIYLIAPNTAYSSRIMGNEKPLYKNNLKGGGISKLTLTEHKELKNQGAIDHLFVHFTIGFPYDNISSGVYSIKINAPLKGKVDTLIKYLTYNSSVFTLKAYLTIQSLICELLYTIDESKWKQTTKDMRVMKILGFIEKNIGQELSNDFLAQKACMATNAFSRLFKLETGTSIQRYIKHKRIDMACLLLSHSEDSISKIAELTGFANRYHFTRVFREKKEISPAKYRKEYKSNVFFE